MIIKAACRKVAMWLLVGAYICCCLLFCTTLIANILESELRVWSMYNITLYIIIPYNSTLCHIVVYCIIS